MPVKQTDPQRYQTRRRKLTRRLSSAGIEAILVTNFTNVTYLTGFSGDDSYLWLGRDHAVLVSDSRYTTQIEEECPELDVHIRTSSQMIVDAVCQVASRTGVRHLGFESGSATYELWEKLGSRLKSAELVPTHGMVEEHRMIKDRHEVAAIREAIEQAERGLTLMRASLVAGMSEREAADALVQSMKRFGAVGSSFEPIVAAGPRAALPHARPTDAVVSDHPFVLVDWGATTRRGYKSDLTRILAAGKIPPKLRKIYRVVLKAQHAGVNAVRPGVPCSQVDAAARKVIEQAGFGKNFGHGLGHGIGLEIHEGPRLSPVSATTLQPGMVVTIEPGIYLPGWGGVRIEDDVLVTSDGAEVLTTLSKELDEAILNLN